MNEYLVVMKSDPEVFETCLSDMSKQGWRVIGFSTDLDQAVAWYNALLERPTTQPAAPGAQAEPGLERPDGGTAGDAGPVV